MIRTDNVLATCVFDFEQINLPYLLFRYKVECINLLSLVLDQGSQVCPVHVSLPLQPSCTHK
jgi:hypothetical protein